MDSDIKIADVDQYKEMRRGFAQALSRAIMQDDATELNAIGKQLRAYFTAFFAAAMRCSAWVWRSMGPVVKGWGCSVGLLLGT